MKLSAKFATVGAAAVALGAGVVGAGWVRAAIEEVLRLDEYRVRCRCVGADPEPWIDEARRAADRSEHGETLWRVLEDRYRRHVAGQRDDAGRLYAARMFAPLVLSPDDEQAIARMLDSDR